MKKTTFEKIIHLPGSKSITNRVLILADLCATPSSLHNILLSDDTETCMRALQDRKESHVINCGDAGTVARFLIPICAASGGEYSFDGSPRMRERPLKTLLMILEQQGVVFRWRDAPYRMPFHMQSTLLNSGSVHVDVRDSSQFLSGLLMAAPLTPQGLILTATAPFSALPYVKMTLDLMRAFGVEPLFLDEYTVQISPHTYQATTISIEPDASTASYFFAAAALSGSVVRIMGLTQQSVQGDLQFLTCLEHIGCDITYHADSIEVCGPDVFRRLDDVNMQGFSDTFMTLAILAPFLPAPTTLHGLRHTRLQESDRIAAMVDGLTRVGIRTQTTEDSLTIFPGTPVGALIDSHNDHRVAMSFATLGLKIEGIQIKGTKAVNKTCPTFFHLLGSLGE